MLEMKALQWLAKLQTRSRGVVSVMYTELRYRGVCGCGVVVALAVVLLLSHCLYSSVSFSLLFL